MGAQDEAFKPAEKLLVQGLELVETGTLDFSGLESHHKHEWEVVVRRHA